MAHILEPLVRDNLWQWLETDSRIDEIAAEVSLGDAGRIDLVTRVGDWYTGYELKAESLTSGNYDNKAVGVIQQLQKYINSEYLDEIYICSMEPDKYAELFKKDHFITKGAPPGEPSLYSVRYSVAKSLYKDYFTISDLTNAVGVPRILGVKKELSPRELRINRFYDNVEKKSQSHHEKFSDVAALDLGDASDLVRSLSIETPNSVGIMGIPLNVERVGAPRYGKRLLIDPKKVFGPDSELEPEIIHDSKTFERTKTPSLSHSNEAWITHSIWVREGGIREATIPNPNSNQALRVDNMSFEGSIFPQDIATNPSTGVIKAFEAKTDITTNKWQGISEQLLKYLRTASFSHLYLAVPEKGVPDIQSRMNEESDQWWSYVGLVGVNTTGKVTYHTDPEGIKIGFDGWQNKSGSTRSVGYGKVVLPDEPEFNAIYGKDEPIRKIKNLSDDSDY